MTEAEKIAAWDKIQEALQKYPEIEACLDDVEIMHGFEHALYWMKEQFEKVKEPEVMALIDLIIPEVANAEAS